MLGLYSSGAMRAAAHERATILDPDLVKRIAEDRRRTGADRFDEVWEGVLRVTPSPTFRHFNILWALIKFLAPVAERHGGRLVWDLGVRRPGTGDDDFRIPDLMFVAPGEEHRMSEDSSYIDGGPSAVFEIRSPGDDTFRKKRFYQEAGVGEFVVVDRDALSVRAFRLKGGKYRAVSPDPEGRVPVRALGVRFATRPVDGEPALFGWDGERPGDAVRIH